jgi:large subunit ribosomal protein L29
MKAKEVRDLSADEQAQKLAEAEKELFNLRLQGAAGQLEKPDRLRVVRREIARIRTIMNQAKAAR